MKKNKNILLIISNILGNATASRRFLEVFKALPCVNLEVVTISQSELDEIKLPLGLNSYQAIKTYIVTRRKLKALNPSSYDIVFSITVQPTLALHGLFKNARIAMWFDGLPLHNEKGWRGRILNLLARRIYNNAFKRVNILLPMSNWADRQINKFCFPSVDKKHICYIGVPLQKWQPLSARTQNNQPIRIISVSNDAKRKGLIDFFLHIKSNNINISNYHFTIITNEVNAQLSSLASDLNLSIINDINHDNLGRLINEYHKADIFFLPTYSDMLPNVLIEATASHLPIVASNIGAIDEVVENGRNGILVDCADWNGFLNALNLVRTQPHTVSEEILERFSDDRFRRIIEFSIEQ